MNNGRIAHEFGGFDNLYCCTKKNIDFPKIKSIPDEWYNSTEGNQLELRKYFIPDECLNCKKVGRGTFTGWIVTPVTYGDKSCKNYPEFEMTDLEVLQLWIDIIKKGGVVSDGIINLFS